MSDNNNNNNNNDESSSPISSSPPSTLYQWVREHLPKPEDGLCMLCHQNPIDDVTNTTGIYNSYDLKNWAWFCSKCHFYSADMNTRYINM